MLVIFFYPQTAFGDCNSLLSKSCEIISNKPACLLNTVTGADISNFSESVCNVISSLVRVVIFSFPRFYHRNSLCPRVSSDTFPEPNERSEIGYFSFSLCRDNSEFSWVCPLYCFASPVFFLRCSSVE